MPYPPLNALRTFEVASRHGSFSKAAEELCVTQSAVSHQIRHLESWLGRPLFARGRGNRLQLLPHGTALSQTLMVSFGNIESACQLTRRTEAPRHLAIAAIPSMAVCWLIPHLSDLRAQHPDIRLRVVYALHGQDIDFADVDLALVFSQDVPNIEGAHTFAFLPGTSAPVCSPALAAQMGSADGNDFIAAGLLHDSGIGGWQEWFDRAGFAAPLTLQGPVFEDFNLLRAATLAGQGIALSPAAIIAEDLLAGRLIQLSHVTVHDNYNYYLIVRPSTTAAGRAAIEAFCDWLFATREKATQNLSASAQDHRAHDSHPRPSPP